MRRNLKLIFHLRSLITYHMEMIEQKVGNLETRRKEIKRIEEIIEKIKNPYKIQ